MKSVLRKNLNRRLRQRRTRAAILGTAEKPRFSVFRSNRFTYVQLIDDQNGKTLAAASTKELTKKAKKAVLAEELGKLVAERAKKSGIKSVVFDRSFYKFHGRVKALAEGARSGGLKF